MSDLFDPPPEDPRQKAREAFRRLVGRYPMTKAEKEALRIEARARAAAKVSTFRMNQWGMENRVLEQNPEFIDLKGNPGPWGEDDDG